MSIASLFLDSCYAVVWDGSLKICDRGEKNYFVLCTKISVGTVMLSLGVGSILWKGVHLSPHVLSNQSFNVSASIVRGGLL